MNNYRDIARIEKSVEKNKQSFSANKQSFSANKNLSFAQNLDSRDARIKQSFSANKQSFSANKQSFSANNDVGILKRELPKITTAVDSLNLFPIKEVLVQTAEGWEAKVVPFLLLKTYPISASDDFCLTPEGVLYKIAHQPLTAEDYKAWRQISPLAPGYLKWSMRVEVSDQEYRRLSPRIFKGLRFLINNV